MFEAALVSLLVALVESTSRTEFDLHKELFNDRYNPLVLPVRNTDDTVSVFTEFALQTIEDLDEKRQKFSVSGYLELSWVNQFLVWNPQNYSGIEEIIVKCEDIWLPDLQVANIIGDPLDLRQKNKHSMLTFKGETDFWLYKTFTVACKIRIRYFPFDSQSCELEFQSWWYPSSKMNLTFTTDEVVLILDQFKESTEWNLETSRGERYELPPGWGHVKFIFNVRRRYMFHVFNLILPLVCISILNLTVFILPAESGEKITLCISVFLTLAVFLTIITSSFPESSDEVSLLSIYVTLQLVYSGITICATVFALQLYHRSGQCRVPWVYRQLCRLNRQQRCVKESICHATGESNAVEDDKQTVNKELTSLTSDVCWASVSRAFDKCCLVLSMFWNILLVVAMMLAFLK